MTKMYGQTFAALNMANAYGPGGGYADGCIAQEENIWRRSDCHFSIDQMEHYSAEESALLNGQNGRVYLDEKNPRVCVRGPEDRSSNDLGYKLLDKNEVFPFYELRAAAIDLRDKNNSELVVEETRKRVRA
jgi:hypothetical protein